MGAAQTHIEKGAAMLSDTIEQKMEDVIDRVPGGSEVRPLIESTMQVLLGCYAEAVAQICALRRADLVCSTPRRCGRSQEIVLFLMRNRVTA